MKDFISGFLDRHPVIVSVVFYLFVSGLMINSFYIAWRYRLTDNFLTLFWTGSGFFQIYVLSKMIKADKK